MLFVLSSPSASQIATVLEKPAFSSSPPSVPVFVVDTPPNKLRLIKPASGGISDEMRVPGEVVHVDYLLSMQGGVGLEVE